MKLTQKQAALLAEMQHKHYEFPGSGQSRTCDMLERQGLMESELCVKSIRMSKKSRKIQMALAYRTSQAGKELLACLQSKAVALQ